MSIEPMKQSTNLYEQINEALKPIYLTQDEYDYLIQVVLHRPINTSKLVRENTQKVLKEAQKHGRFSADTLDNYISKIDSINNAQLTLQGLSQNIKKSIQLSTILKEGNLDINLEEQLKSIHDNLNTIIDRTITRKLNTLSSNKSVNLTDHKP